MAACGTSAGFDVLQVLSEPTAVAVAHRADECPAGVLGAGAAARCVVVDLGASGLDVAVLSVHRGVVALEAHEHSGALSGASSAPPLAAAAAAALRFSAFGNCHASHP